ncbi:MAG TPA: hydrogenase maturation nickel metallochaperone HypA [Bryobacteraceae bacterium]|nr:hydrogenase maturation nickel metallochaperone HypA [Bryobacteraceae bacterium]
MHEAGIAAEILEIAKTQAAEHGHMRVSEVAVRLGEMSGVVAEALEFAFEALRDGAAEGARIEIKRIPVLARCEACRVESRPGADLVLWCAQCGRPMKVLEGEELTVESVVLEDGDQ